MKSPVSSPVPEVRPTRSRLAEAVPLARCDEFNPRGQPCSPAQIKAEPAAYASGSSGRRAPPAPPLSAIANDAVTGGKTPGTPARTKKRNRLPRGAGRRARTPSPAALAGHPDRPRRAPAMDRRLGASDRGGAARPSPVGTLFPPGDRPSRRKGQDGPAAEPRRVRGRPRFSDVYVNRSIAQRQGSGPVRRAGRAVEICERAARVGQAGLDPACLRLTRAPV